MFFRVFASIQVDRSTLIADGHYYQNCLMVWSYLRRSMTGRVLPHVVCAWESLEASLPCTLSGHVPTCTKHSLVSTAWLHEWKLLWLSWYLRVSTGLKQVFRQESMDIPDTVSCYAFKVPKMTTMLCNCQHHIWICTGQIEHKQKNKCQILLSFLLFLLLWSQGLLKCFRVITHKVIRNHFTDHWSVSLHAFIPGYSLFCTYWVTQGIKAE